MLEKAQTREIFVRTVITTPLTHPYPILPASNRPPPRLNSRLVRNRRDALRLVVLDADCSCLPGLSGFALQVDVDALGLGLLPLLCVLLDTLDEVIPRSGLADMLNTDVNALLHVSVADLLLAGSLLDQHYRRTNSYETYRMTPTAFLVTL
jgi:hypothetical protein